MRLKRPRKQVNRRNNRIGPVINDYKPLLGGWLIEMALLLNWYRPTKSGIWPDIFTDDDFLVLTGINGPDEDEDDEDEYSYVGRPTASKCRKILETQLKKLRKIKPPDTLPLFDNIQLLAELIGLNEADQEVLTFAVAVDLVSEFKGALFTRCEKASNQLICQILAKLTGLSETDFHAAISEDSLLISTGIIRNARSIVDLDEKLTVIDGLSPILLTPHLSAEELTGRFLKRAANSTLTLDHFPYLAKDAGALKDYLKNVLKERVQGVNILLHGKPGVGKTEFVQSLVADLGADLYEIAFANEDGDPIKGTERLHAFNFCQRLLARTTNAVLMFDEIEDVFPVDFGMFSFLMGDIGGGKSKAWINRTMERNPVPAIWVCNRVGHIDPAYLRRFDYSIAFSAPPVAVRLRIAKHHLDCFDPPQTMLESIARNDEITPGQLDRAAKVARIAGRGNNIRAIQLVEQTLDKSITLLGQKRTANRGVLRTGYHLEFLNTDFDISAIVHGLRRRPHGTFCFYGEAGTGKSELARYISEEIGMPLIIKRASDLISKWVGESEKNIAAMFTEARQQDSLLLLDEADSFLADRRDAQRSWEVTQVNELLTQMEAFEGIFICTTNLMEKLDPASLRRFAFKVKFSPLTVDQKKRMFGQELIRLGCIENNIDAWESKISELRRLTPGDFVVAARQFELWDIPATPGKLYEMLLKECEAKGASTRSIGFNAKSML
jgi:transitional endoplasmic reticulum ATPase